MSSKKDNYYLNQALNLAKDINGLTGSNPAVGALIVKNDEILSLGKTGFNGRPHAEFEAIKKCKKKGFKRFVNLYYNGTLHTLRKNTSMYKFNY